MEGSAGDIVTSRLAAYCQRYAVGPTVRLGAGKDGGVWATSDGHAVKVFADTGQFEREVAVYERLAQRGVREVHGHHIPDLVAVDPDLLTVTMSIVSRPFVLDFASAHLDTPPVFPEDVMAEWLADKKEQFGKNWPHAARVLAGLRAHGVHMMDVHPGNIGFVDEPSCGDS